MVKPKSEPSPRNMEPAPQEGADTQTFKPRTTELRGLARAISYCAGAKPRNSVVLGLKVCVSAPSCGAGSIFLGLGSDFGFTILFWFTKLSGSAIRFCGAASYACRCRRRPILRSCSQDFFAPLGRL